MTGRDPGTDEPQVADSPSQPTSHAAFEEGEEAPPPGVLAMAIVRWGLVLAMAVAAAASLFYVFGARDRTQSEVHAELYYCPMHPAVVQDHPGDCPICNMTLVARAPASTPRAPSASMTPGVSSADAGLPRGLVELELPPERVQLMGMRTAEVRRGPLPEALTVVGVIAPTESAVSSVQTRFSGWVQELHVAQTGEAVKRGQLLARIYSPELLSAQQELLQAKGFAHGAHGSGSETTLLDSARNRLLLLGMESSELAEVERSGQPHRAIEVRSPARGYVSDKTALLGVLVQPGSELFRIADLSHVWALLEVLERDAGRLQVGQDATVSLPSYPGESFQGKVMFVYPALSADTRTLRARVELKNPGLKLKPGMFANVMLRATGQADSQMLSIPREALIDLGEHRYVFVEREAGHFEPRVVQVGARTGESVQIVSGLREHERVVSTGNFLLDSESRLRAASAGP